MSTPAHKVIGDVGKPGQIINEPNKKLTFDEWFNDRCGNDTYTQQEDIKSRMQWAWDAAQENK